MRQKPGTKQSHGEKVVKDIRRATRKQYSAEEKIRIVLDGLKGEDSIAELIRDTVDALFASYLVRFQIQDERASPAFVGRLIESNVYKAYVNGVRGGAAQPNANALSLGNFEFKLPPLPTQERIAAILSAYDDLIENNRRRIALLEQAARLLYREWFVHFCFPGHETARFKDGLPEGWKTGTIADLFDTSAGGTPSRKNEGFYGGHINWLKTQELQNCFIFDTGEKSQRTL